MKSCALLIGISLLLPPTTQAGQLEGTPEQRSPEARIVTEFLAGGALGVVLAIPGASVIALNCGDDGCDDDNARTGVYLFCSGMVLGNAIGVYFVGSDHRGDDSFLATLAGAAGGMALGAILLSDSGDAGLIPLVLLPPLGATLAFEASRRPFDGGESASLIDALDDAVQIGVPRVFVAQNARTATRKYTIDVLRYRF